MANSSNTALPANVIDQQDNRDHDLPFFKSDPPEVPAKMAELLETYSGLPTGSHQIEHVQHLRDRAYQAYHYPCLGMYRFLELALSSHPLYDRHVLPLLRGEKDNIEKPPRKDPPIFLDLGTCLGQDVRKLLFDGAPLDSVYGADILDEFVDVGYALFLDEDKLPRSHFVVPADFFDPDSRLQEFDGRADVIHANAIFHLFNWEDQVKVAKRVAKLMRPKGGSLLLGSQVGNQKPGEDERWPGRRAGLVYRHDPKTWDELWQIVGQELGISFTVRSSMVPHPLTKRPEAVHQGLSRISFEVWRD